MIISSQIFSHTANPLSLGLDCSVSSEAGGTGSDEKIVHMVGETNIHMDGDGDSWLRLGFYRILRLRHRCYGFFWRRFRCYGFVLRKFRCYGLLRLRL